MWNQVWNEISRELYWTTLEKSRPHTDDKASAYEDSFAFLVGEPSDHAICEVTGTMSPRYDAFLRRGEQISHGERHYQSIRPLTVAEFRKDAFI